MNKERGGSGNYEKQEATCVVNDGRGNFVRWMRNGESDQACISKCSIGQTCWQYKGRKVPEC